MVDQGEKLQQSFTKNNKIFAQFMVDRACQAFHLSTILPALASGAHLTILVFGIWGGVIFGIWDAVFGIWDDVLGIWDAVFGIYDAVFGIWDDVLGIWDAVFGIYDAVFGIWGTVFGIQDTGIWYWEDVFGIYDAVFGTGHHVQDHEDDHILLCPTMKRRACSQDPCPFLLI